MIGKYSVGLSTRRRTGLDHHRPFVPIISNLRFGWPLVITQGQVDWALERIAKVLGGG